MGRRVSRDRGREESGCPRTIPSKEHSQRDNRFVSRAAYRRGVVVGISHYPHPPVYRFCMFACNDFLRLLAVAQDKILRFPSGGSGLGKRESEQHLILSKF